MNQKGVSTIEIVLGVILICVLSFAAFIVFNGGTNDASSVINLPTTTDLLS